MRDLGHAGLDVPSTARRRVRSWLGMRRIADGIIRRVRSVLQRIVGRADRIAIKVAVKSRFLSSWYYATWSRAFSREHQRVLAGRLRYAKNLHDPHQSSALLRRNIHGLEKGLLMRPRRDEFATDYICDTVACYAKLVNKSADEKNHDELHWANDVLAEYFQVVKSHPNVDRARTQFESLGKPRDSVNCEQRIPYRRNLASRPSVSYQQLLDLARRRRSVRWFLETPIDRKLIDQAIEVATLSPSACNRQPFQFRILDDRELACRVAGISMGTAGYHENIPVLIAIVGQLGCYFSERDRHLIYIDGSLAAMSLVYALETLELGTCCINWPDMEDMERQIAAELRLADDERVVMLMAVGYPDPTGMVAFSQKKPLEQIRRYNLE